MKISRQGAVLAASVTAVIGLGIGGGVAAMASGSGPAAPKPSPAGQVAVVTTQSPAVSSSAVTSPKPAVVSSSVAKATPKKRAVKQQENVVTEPTQPAQQPADSQPANTQPAGTQTSPAQPIDGPGVHRGTGAPPSGKVQDPTAPSSPQE